MEEETAGLRHRRTKEAIELAMQGRWQAAVESNQSLLESFPDDTSAYNRLGRAYMELGDIPHAREAYKQALTLDPYNSIARKNLARLAHIKAVPGAPPANTQVAPQIFIEETGKAGVVNLYQLGLPEVVVRMVAGDRVYLKVEGSGLAVETGQGERLGLVEPKTAQRLVRFIKGGNEYTAAIVSTTEDGASIIIREVYQHPDQVGQLSFPPKEFKAPRPYVSDRLRREEQELEYEEAEETAEEGVEEETHEEETGYTIIGVEKELPAEDLGAGETGPSEGRE
jgi:tetratricopeptide (TPR) repeat protein